jgi:hypothetical protein
MDRCTTLKAHWRGPGVSCEHERRFLEGGFRDPLEKLVAWTDLSAPFAIRSKPMIAPFNNSIILQTAPKFDFENYRDNIDEVLAML